MARNNKLVFSRFHFRYRWEGECVTRRARPIFFAKKGNLCNSFSTGHEARSIRFSWLVPFLFFYAFFVLDSIFKWNVCFCLGIKFADSKAVFPSGNKLHLTLAAVTWNLKKYKIIINMDRHRVGRAQLCVAGAHCSHTLCAQCSHHHECAFESKQFSWIISDWNSLRSFSIHLHSFNDTHTRLHRFCTRVRYV